MPVITKSPRGDDIVILSRTEYDALIAVRDEEMAADSAHANRILAAIENGTEPLLTSEQADQLLNAKSPLAFWRKYRGLTQEVLAKSIGVAQGFISEIESGSKTGDVQTLAAIARVLEISLDDLVLVPPPLPARKGAAKKARTPLRETGRRRRV